MSASLVFVAGCADGLPASDMEEPVASVAGEAVISVSEDELATRWAEYRPRIMFDSGWNQTSVSGFNKDYRLRIYTSDLTSKLAIVVYGNLGGAAGARFPKAEFKGAAAEPCEFDDSAAPISLSSGFAWVRFAPAPSGRNRPPLPAPAPFRLLASRALYVSPVGTEFVVASSSAARIDVVAVTSPGQVVVTQRFNPEPARRGLGQGELLRTGTGLVPGLIVEPLTDANAATGFVTDVLAIVGRALDSYNDLPEASRPTVALNPPAGLGLGDAGGRRQAEAGVGLQAEDLLR